MRYFSLMTFVVLMLAPRGVVMAQRAGEEIQYPSADFAKLDTFESINIQDADRLYRSGDLDGAYATYRAYSFEFPRSPAVPYVLLRMGRCLHRMNKRNTAVQAYQDVVDYFPDDVRYAAAALYYMGECHAQNGDTDRQTAVWARMVKDDDYVNQPNSGTALIHLARLMEGMDNHGEAVEYHWRTAINFAQSNPNAAQASRNAVLHHYVVRSPNHEKLQAFFTRTNGFASPHGRAEDPQTDPRYWNAVLDGALRSANDAVCRYWVARIGDSLADNDGIRIKVLGAQLVYEKDMNAWYARMTRQFANQTASLARLTSWVPHFSRDLKLQQRFVVERGGPLLGSAEIPETVALLERVDASLRGELYAQHIQSRVSSLDRKDKVLLMNRLRHPLGLHNEAQAVMRTVSPQGMSDEEIRDYAFFNAHYGEEEAVIRILERMQNKDLASKARFDYYMGRRHRNRPFQEKALAELQSLKKIPAYATGDLTWTEAELLHGLGRHEEAIPVYRAANRQPDSTWRVTDCLIALKRYDEAIRTVQGLESVGGEVAAQAAMKVADVRKISGDRAKEVDQLRLVSRRYPNSGQSSAAHIRLQEYGAAVVGGVGE